jgi:hypothetical protein
MCSSVCTCSILFLYRKSIWILLSAHHSRGHHSQSEIYFSTYICSSISRSAGGARHRQELKLLSFASHLAKACRRPFSRQCNSAREAWAGDGNRGVLLQRTGPDARKTTLSGETHAERTRWSRPVPSPARRTRSGHVCAVPSWAAATVGLSTGRVGC